MHRNQETVRKKRPYSHPAHYLAYLLIGLGIVTPVAGLIIPMTLPELVSKSELVVEGVVLATACRWRDDGSGIIVTDVLFAVEDCYKGEKPDQRLIVETEGGVIGDIGLIVEDTPIFRTGESAILFLSSPDENGSYRVTNLYNGKYTVVDNVVRETRLPVMRFRNQVRAIIAQQEGSQQ